MEKYQILRKKYPKFIYRNYSYKISKVNEAKASSPSSPAVAGSINNLEIFFDFRIGPGICFTPKITVENIDESQLKKLERGALNNLVFHLGLAEIPSYWKATCSPEIEIQAGFLNEKQIRWWKDLIIHGMGQFFYENQIDFTSSNFLKIKSFRKTGLRNLSLKKLKNRILIPIGGGKDSIVTLEILKKVKKKINCFSLNPTEATKKIIKAAAFQTRALAKPKELKFFLTRSNELVREDERSSSPKPIIVRRKIDDKLLELNRKGFLNGHTPFSAYLAFLSILCALIFDYKYMAFSNERSSNEGNIKYLKKAINHQYSKSFNFEKKFRRYSQKYLTSGVEYFSFLRPLYEIQIAKLFSKYPRYFPIFLSCNEAYKTASGTKKPLKKWCGQCPKCLFVFTTLYPFLEIRKLIKIFRKNLFKDKKLISLMLQLIGEKKFKPFECIGTQKESLIAFYLSWEKDRVRTLAKPFPLLKYFQNKIIPKYPSLERESKKLINAWDNQNNLPNEFRRTLKGEVN